MGHHQQSSIVRLYLYTTTRTRNHFQIVVNRIKIAFLVNPQMFTQLSCENHIQKTNNKSCHIFQEVGINNILTKHVFQLSCKTQVIGMIKNTYLSTNEYPIHVNLHKVALLFSLLERVSFIGNIVVWTSERVQLIPFQQLAVICTQSLQFFIGIYTNLPRRTERNTGKYLD